MLTVMVGDSIRKKDTVQIARAKHIIEQNMQEQKLIKDLDTLNEHLNSIILYLEKGKKLPGH